MAEDNGLDCLDLLEETPAILRGLMRELSHDDAHWKPAPDRFSVAEVLVHVWHSEGQAVACLCRKKEACSGVVPEVPADLRKALASDPGAEPADYAGAFALG